MTKMEYAKEVAKLVEKDCPCEVKEVQKNNNIVKTGIVLDLGSNMRPTVYIDEFYEREQSEEEAYDKISEIIDNLREKTPEKLDISDLLNIKTASARIFFELVNADQERVQNGTVISMPTILEDLVKIYKIDVTSEAGDSGDTGSTASITITPAILEQLAISKEDLDEIAMENTPKLRPSKIQSIADALGPMWVLFDDGNMPEMPEVPLTVVSNEKGIGGAAVMLYPDLLASIAEKMDDDLIVIPSSIHEVLIMPMKSGEALAGLASIITEVNQTSVAPEEILSDHPYQYTREYGLQAA